MQYILMYATAMYSYLSKTCGYFLKPKVVCEQKCLGNTAIDHS